MTQFSAEIEAEAVRRYRAITPSNFSASEIKEYNPECIEALCQLLVDTGYTPPISPALAWARADMVKVYPTHAQYILAGEWDGDFHSIVRVRAYEAGQKGESA